MTERPMVEQTAEILKMIGPTETAHLERWLADLLNITPEEHRAAQLWIMMDRLGFPCPPEPECVTKINAKPPVDDRFWELADQYGLYETEFRRDFLMAYASMCNKAHQGE